VRRERRRMVRGRATVDGGGWVGEVFNIFGRE